MRARGVYGICVETWSAGGHLHAIEERTVVSEIGEQWSPAEQDGAHGVSSAPREGVHGVWGSGLCVAEVVSPKTDPARMEARVGSSFS